MSDIPEHLDARALRRAFDRAAATGAPADDPQREVADELLDRLAGVRVQPSRIVDLGAGTGYAAGRLQRMYRDAEVLAVDFAPAAAARVRSRWRPGRQPLGVCADAGRLPLADASVDLVFSNLACHCVGDLVALFTEVRRVLRPEGVLMFSTLGPDSLAELRAAWAGVDDAVHVHAFPDMHDVGDAVLRAGLTDPVMDVDRIVRAYPDAEALMRAIKALGAGNAARGRPRGLTGRGRMRRVAAAYPDRDEGGGVRATWEIAFGHAWGAATPRAGRGDAGEFHVPVESIGRAPARTGAGGD